MVDTAVAERGTGIARTVRIYETSVLSEGEHDLEALVASVPAEAVVNEAVRQGSTHAIAEVLGIEVLRPIESSLFLPYAIVPILASRDAAETARILARSEQELEPWPAEVTVDFLQRYADWALEAMNLGREEVYELGNFAHTLVFTPVIAVEGSRWEGASFREIDPMQAALYLVGLVVIAGHPAVPLVVATFAGTIVVMSVVKGLSRGLEDVSAQVMVSALRRITRRLVKEDTTDEHAPEAPHESGKE